jgi:glycerol uptake facilitator protein/aquaporin Z
VTADRAATSDPSPPGSGPARDDPVGPVPHALAVCRRGRWSPLPACLAEAAGSALLVLTAVTAFVVTSTSGAPAAAWPLHLRLTLIGCAMGGVVVAVAVSPLGRASGAHLNPAVSVFQWTRGRMSGRDALGYVLFQLGGSVVGAVVGRLVWGGRAVEVRDAVVQPAACCGTVVTAGAEAASTVLLVVVLAAAQRLDRPRVTPWLLGGLTAALIVTTGALTGAGVNPVRNFGPQLLSGTHEFFWVYLLSPIAGAVVAGALARRRTPLAVVLRSRRRHRRCRRSRAAGASTGRSG